MKDQGKIKSDEKKSPPVLRPQPRVLVLSQQCELFLAFPILPLLLSELIRYGAFPHRENTYP